jgi:hypothetical protein
MTQGTQGRADAAQELASRLGGKKTPGEQKDALSELETTIGKVENAEARRLLMAQARSLRANLELEEKQTQEKIRRIEEGGRDNRENTDSEDREVTKASITANALLLLEKGVPANVVGQYLIGSQTTGIPIGGFPGGQQQGITFDNVLSIFKMAKEEKGTAPELTAILNKLTDKVSELENKVAAAGHQEPKKAWVVHPDGTKEEIQPGEPIIIKQPAPATGENIEFTKEQNRHAEEVEKIKNEKDYKDKIAGTVASLPEKIGAGLAASLVDAEQPPGRSAARTAPADSTIKHLKCEVEGCGYDIPYAANALEVTCPKCKMVYQRTPEKK